MKKLLFPAVAAVALTGCIHPAPVDSLIMVDEVVTGAEFIDNSVQMKKAGHSVSKHVLIFGTGDASIRAAMRDGEITKVHHVDHKSTNVLGLYMSNETIVWGE